MNNILSKYNQVTNNNQTNQPTKNPQLLWEQMSTPQFWINLINTVVSDLIKIILLSLLFWILYRFGKRVVHKVSHNLRSKQTSSNRSRTIATLTQNIYFYFLAFIYIYCVLAILGAPVGTLITGAGIFSLALGLGAQGFVSDVVTGFFILAEQQFDVGDSVKVSDVSGTVTYIGLRTTQIRSGDGTLNYVPNRNITVVQNLSRGNMTTIIELQLFPKTDIKKVTQVLSQVNQKLTPDDPDLITAPRLLGPTEVNNGLLTYQIQIDTKNGAQLIVKRKFLEAYLLALQKANIPLPENKLDLNK
ncbi:mechanosensitive ion channel family protein [Bombilactobacillus thymidiniphilus]|uniref:Mechanosensitive ion channel family protein n=1 Tax=Bombilactobacillus thymidiniphilus TaxID=2923363 RepID=A0ABY4PEE8_9LACO|nr:mechanosensitive ion channel family protein [Bombilactobacillus thymidiniphilus]UQS83886.1 mechanosensitive ion channel family protein [Bombilactobacillus thymidiniphilus]